MKIILFCLLFIILFSNHIIVQSQKYDGRVLVLKSRVFIDNNKNTIYEDSEPGFGGIYVVPLDNAVDYLGQPLRPQYTDSNGDVVWDGLMERVTYRFNYSNPKGYYFATYDIGLNCHPGKECIRDPAPLENYKGSIVIEHISGFEVPLTPSTYATANSSILCLKISVDLGIPVLPPTTDTTGSYSSASSSTQYGGTTTQVGVSGIAFLDTNKNSIMDSDEMSNVVSGLTVYIQPNSIGANGYLINQPVISKASGVWSIGNLKSNTYYTLTFSNPKDYIIGDLNENNICRDCLHAPTPAEKPIDAVYVQTLESFKVPLIYSPGTRSGSQNVTLSTFVSLFGSLTGSATTGAAPTKPPQQSPMFGVAIYGSFFLDNNNDGIPNNNEQPVSGVQASITENGDPVPSGFSRDPIKPNPFYSQSNGIFLFDDLVPGREYQLEISNPKGYAFGNIIPDYSCNNCIKKTQATDGLKAKYYFTLPAWQIPLVPFSGIDEGEQTINLVVTVPSNIEPPSTPSPTPSQTPSQTPSPTPPQTTATQTPNPSYTGSALVGNMFTDFSGNGLKESNETWYAGLKIILLDSNKNQAKDASGKLVPPSITDSNGRFVFENIAPGNYSIKIIEGLKGVYDPGVIGPFKIDKGVIVSKPTDGVASPTLINLGGYGLFPIGNSSCSGIVFDDLNFNNIFDKLIDKGLVGIIIKIYCPVYGYLINTVITGQDGRWTCNGLWEGMKYRCDFDNKGKVSTGYPSHRFITGGQNAVDMGVAMAQNSQGQMNANNPSGFVTTCYVKGPHLGTYKEEAAVVSFTSNATGTAYAGAGGQYMTKMAKHSQVGATYGVVYRQETGDTFVSAFYKSYSDFGPSGTGAIYRIDKNLQTTTWVDLNQIFGANYTGPNPQVWDSTYLSRAAAFVGKTSLGDLASNNQFLFVTNLYQNDIVQIPWTQTPTASNIVKLKVPNAGCTFSEDWRIFGLTFYQDTLYVGGVCTGEKGSALNAYVLRYNINFGNFTNVFQFSLNYPRGCRTSVSCAATKWQSWSTHYNNSHALVGSLQFDDSNRLIVGLMDRGSDVIERVSGPDMLLACPTNNGYFTLENKGVCGGVTGAMPLARSKEKKPYGPGGGQYFYVYSQYHDYNAAWGLAKAGPQLVVATGFDYNTPVEGAVRWYNTTTGKITRAYGLYVNTKQAYAFSKSNGLGDIAPMFPPSMDVVQHGRVWFDCNGNGIMDCNEVGLANIKVFLFYANVPQYCVAYTYTDQNGYFSFQLQPGKDYAVAIYASEIKDKFGDFVLSPILNQDPNLECIYSDAFLGGTNNDILWTSIKAPTVSGHSYNGTNYGIVRTSAKPYGGYGHW